MSLRNVLVDTGPLVALIRRDDAHHERCSRMLHDIAQPMLTCWPVITEAMWILRDSRTGQEKLLAGFNTGLLRLLPLDESSIPSITRLLIRYASLSPQLADICLVHLAERESIRTIFTLDRRDFRVYRYRGNSEFRLLPD